MADLLAAFTTCALSLVVLVLGAGVDAWRHDSLYYLDSYEPKFLGEGRWLIWLLFRPMTALPGGLVWLLSYLVFCGFSYRLARAYCQDRWTAVLFALLTSQIPSELGQSLWPTVMLPGALLLLIAVLVVDRLPWAVFYILFGVLFFGVSQQYYFFLPLLHVPGVLRSPRGPLRATTGLLALWLLGFVSGYLCALALVYLVSGNAGLQIASWRGARVVTDLASVVENLASRGHLLAEHLGLLRQLPLAAIGLLAMTVVGVFGWSRQELLVRVSVFGAVGLAIYAATIPIGVTIQFRTVTPLFYAILACGFLGSKGRLQRDLYPLGVLFVFLPFWSTNFDNLQWYRTVTAAYRSELVRAVPLAPASYSGLVMVGGTARTLQKRVEESTGRRARYIEPFLSEESGWDIRWRPSAIAAGFRSVDFCMPAGCRRLLSTMDSRGCVTESETYCVHGTTEDGRLVVSFASP